METLITRRPPIAAAALVTALTLGASSARGDVVLPSSAFANGQNAADFRTDLRIFNPSSTPVTVVPVLYDQAAGGEAITKPAITVPGRGQVAFDNVLSSLFGRSKPSFGPIRLQTTAALIVSASVNNVNSCGNGATSGQWLPGIDVAQAAVQGNLPQIALSADSASGYRTNLVFFNPGTSDAHVTAALRKGDGTLVSTLTLATLGANGWTQQAVGSAFANTAGLTDTNLFIEFTSDQPVLSFASVIANASGDPFAIVAQRDPASPPAASYTIAPANPAVNQTVTFTDTSTNSPTAQLWDFGDGTVSTGGAAVVTHAYTAAGTYHTAHFVVNAAAVSGTTRDVNVSGGSQGPVAVAITASQWQYTPSNVNLKVGTTYQITWTSQDVMHGVGGIPELGITSCDVITKTVPCVVTFTPAANQAGVHHYACTQSSCGAGHNNMAGTITIAP